MAIIFEIFRIKIIYNFYDTAIYLFRREMTIFWPYTEVNIKIKCPVYISIVINTEVNAFFSCTISLLSGVNTSMMDVTNFGPENGLTPVWGQAIMWNWIGVTSVAQP